MRRLALVLASAGAAVFVTGIQAQNPLRLLADLETTPRPPRSSEPFSFARVGGWTYFTADDGVNGRELFKTAGTPQSTALVADVFAGAESSNPVGLTPVGSRILFFANDGVHGVEPWVSDGTRAGTRLLIDAAPGGLGSSSAAYVVGARALFEADDGTGRRVYGTDGTSAGTEILLDLGTAGAPEEVSLDRSAEAVDPTFGRIRYFPARTGASIGIWRTDGTRGGTRHVVSPPEWVGAGLLNLRFARGDGFVVVHVRLANLAHELWRVDSGGAVRLTAHSGYGLAAGSWWFDGATWIGFEQVFGTGPRLVRTDGTPAGTTLVSLPSGIDTVRILGEIGGGLWLLGRVDDDATALMRLDPGSLQPVVTGYLSFPFLTGFTVWIPLGPRFLFAGSGAVWALDPGAASITRLAGSGSVTSLGEGIGRAYLAIGDATLGTELGVSDGTPAGTRLLADLNRSSSGTYGSGVTEFASFGRGAAFVTKGLDHRFDVWVTDGTEPGTVRVLSDLGYVAPMAAAGDLLFFNAGEPFHRPGLFVTDGTATGSRRVDTPSGPGLYASPAPIALGEEVIGFDGSQLVASDGESIRVVAPLPTPRVMPNAARLGEQVFFELDVGAGWGAREVPIGLWVTDGTAGGTRRVAGYSTYYVGNSWTYTGLAAGLDRIFFTVYASRPPFELWSSDGTPTNTSRIAVLPESQSRDPIRIVASGEQVFIAWSGHLWSSDGTPQGTRRQSCQPIANSVLVPLRGGLLFEAVDPVSQRHVLWFAAGGTADPVPIQAGYDRYAARGSEVMADGQRRAYFLADDVAARTWAVWVTDGTSEGTRRTTGPLIRDEWFFSDHAVAGGILLVAADDPIAGVEPHVIDLGATAQRLSPGCGGRGREASLDVVVHGAPRGGFELLGRSSAGRVATVLISAPPRAPVSFPAGGKCWLDVDASSAVEFVALPVAAGRFERLVALPDDPALYGLQAVLQALVGPTDGPLGLDLTNGVLVTIGP